MYPRPYPRRCEMMMRQSGMNPPDANPRMVGCLAGLLARLFLLEFVRKHGVGDPLVRSHAAYREPLAFELDESAMIHGALPINIEEPPVLFVDIE